MAPAMGRRKSKIQCRWGLTGPLPWFFHVCNGLVGGWSELSPFNKVQSVAGVGWGGGVAGVGDSQPVLQAISSSTHLEGRPGG